MNMYEHLYIYHLDLHFLPCGRHLECCIVVMSLTEPDPSLWPTLVTRKYVMQTRPELVLVNSGEL